MLQCSVVDRGVQSDNILLIHPCLETLCLCAGASKMWRRTPLSLTSVAYWWHLLNISPGDLTKLLAVVPLEVCCEVWFQHDDTPAHCSNVIRDYLDEAFGNRWIEHGGPITWTPRSSYLIPLNFFLWGSIQSLVYETPVERQLDRVTRIAVAAGTIWEMLEIFQSSAYNMARRCRTYS